MEGFPLENPAPLVKVSKQTFVCGCIETHFLLCLLMKWYRRLRSLVVRVDEKPLMQWREG